MTKVTPKKALLVSPFLFRSRRHLLGALATTRAHSDGLVVVVSSQRRADERMVDAPDKGAMMAGLFSVAETGNVSSETLRAFTDEEMERILAGS